MALALRTERRRATRDETKLERLLTEGRAFSAEFPVFLANHLPMILVAMHRLGGSDERLGEYFACYRDDEPPAAAAARDRADRARPTGTSALGDRARETDYRTFFQRRSRAAWARAAPIAAYLPTLLPGLAASATHGLMRLAYGVMRDDDAEIATALGYWAATYLELGAATGAAPTTDDPAEVLLRMRAVDSFRHVETELDLLWHFMRAMAAKPEFAPVGRLARDRSRDVPSGCARPRSRSMREPWIFARCMR